MAGWIIAYESDGSEERDGATSEWHDRGFMRVGEVWDVNGGRCYYELVEDEEEATVFESKEAADAFIDANTDRHYQNCYPIEQIFEPYGEPEPVGWHEEEMFFLAVEKEAE